MNFKVYVLFSPSIGLTYVGQTADLSRRIQLHREAKSFWTKRCHDWQLIYEESFQTRGEAMKRERFLKTGKGKEELQRLLIRQKPGG